MKTKIETLKKIHDEILEQSCRNEIDVQFFIDKSKNYKKNSPENKENLAKSKEQEGFLFWNKMLLKTIEHLIEKYE